jgi:hypothetical protein
MSELIKREKPSADISKVTDGLNVFDALKAAAKAIANESPEILTGVLATVLPPALPVVRLFHAGAKNNLIRQIVVEVEEFRKKGAINEEYLKTDEAHACFADLLDYIDKTSPDPKRYDAIRTAFLKVLDRKQTGKNAPYDQQMLRIICELSAGEIVVMGTIYKMGMGGEVRRSSWLCDVANNSGLLRLEIVEEIEESLMKKRLIYEHGDLRAAEHAVIKKWGMRNRLTTLGQEVCETFMRPEATA